ncbi:MAG: hypothetical protein ACYC6B_09285 [Thermoleophilia bacterium]
MKKLTILTIGAIIIMGGASAVSIGCGSGDQATDATKTASGQSGDVKTGDGVLVTVDACDVLTATVARQILGDAAARGDLPAGSTSTKDVSVSSCVYTAKIDPGAAVRISNTKGVSVLVRSAKTDAGANPNRAQFGTGRPAAAQDVAGLGDDAYFDTQYGQLNVLKGGNWYIVTSYSGKTNGTLESSRQLADLLEFV